MAYDENPNNIWENTDILELIISKRLKLCGIENEGKIAKFTDQLLNLLREIQEERGPIISTDNYQAVLTSFLFIIGGRTDGEEILSDVQDILDQHGN